MGKSREDIRVELFELIKILGDDYEEATKNNVTFSAQYILKYAIAFRRFVKRLESEE